MRHLALPGWQRAFAAFLVLLGVSAAVAFSTAVAERYDATVSVQLESTPTGPGVAATMAERRQEIAERVPTEAGEQVAFEAAPGNPRVLVRATSGERQRARQLATEYAVELVATERFVDRLGTFEDIRDLQAELADLPASGGTRTQRRDRRALSERLEAAQERQVTDSAIRIPEIRQVDGPEPLRNALIMLPVAVLVALAALRLLRSVDARMARGHGESAGSTG